LNELKAKAGLTWDYLQFIQENNKSLFLIKNAAYFNENCFSHAVLPNKDISREHRRTYLHELSKINNALEFPSKEKNPSITSEQNIQLSLFVPESQIQEELDQFRSFYNEFHVLTYKIDEAYQISEVMHFLPNSEDNVAYTVEDLSIYIAGAELTDDEREIVAPESNRDLISPEAFDIGIFEEKERK